jgi:hypothetical protein
MIFDVLMVTPLPPFFPFFSDHRPPSRHSCCGSRKKIRWDSHHFNVRKSHNLRSGFSSCACLALRLRLQTFGGCRAPIGAGFTVTKS